MLKGREKPWQPGPQNVTKASPLGCSSLMVSGTQLEWLEVFLLLQWNSIQDAKQFSTSGDSGTDGCCSVTVDCIGSSNFLSLLVCPVNYQ